MDYSKNAYLPQMPQRNPSKGLGWKIFFGIVLAFSLIANLILILALVASTFLLTAERSDYYLEKVLREGQGASKIAVIRIGGIINNELSEKVIKQIKTAREDKAVKAVIFRTNTPGGAVAASDRIYDEICRFKAESGKPAVAFMETIATSGGYYTSCACDKIIAEPTTITGSIGVIMGHFVFQELFEQKLGIKPFIAKSGTKKDWPTTFEPVTEEQAAYLNDKLIMPAYERFVGIVAKSRKDILTAQQVKILADGSIYNAPEAIENGLIDDVGYIQEAIVLAESLADISDAKVVEYAEPFSLESLLGAQTIFKLNMDSLSSLATPQLMYIWDAGFLR
jgi:protease-4